MDKRIITFLVVLLLCISLVGIGVAWDKTDYNIKKANDQKDKNNGKHLGQKNHNPSDFKYVNNKNKDGLEIATKNLNSINAHFNNGRLYLSQNKHDVHTIRIPYGQLKKLNNFETDRVQITHINDLGEVDAVWTQSVKNDNGYAYLEDVPFSEVIVDGVSATTAFTGSVTGNTTVNFADTLDVSNVNVTLSGLSSIAESDYWIDPDVTNAYFVANIPAGETVEYYTKQEAGYSPDGEQVFEYYNPAENTSEWTGATSALSIYNGNLRFTDGGSSAYTVYLSHGATLPDDVIVDVYATVNNYVNEDYVTIGTTDGESLSDRLSWCTFEENQNAWKNIYTSYKTVASPINYNRNHWQTNIRTSDSQIDYYIYNNSGSLIGSLQNDPYAYGSPVDFTHIMLYCGSNNRYTRTDVYDITIRQYADVTTTVTDMGDYYKISVTNNEATDLTGYQVQVAASELGITSDTESWKFYKGGEVTTSVTGDSYTTNTSESFDLTPTEPISSLSFTASNSDVAYSYDFDLGWTQDAYRYSENTDNGYADLKINFTPSETIDSGWINASYNTIDLTAQDYLGSLSTTLDGVSDSAARSGNDISLDVSSLDTSEHWVNHSIAYNNDPTVTSPDRSGLIDEPITFSADFNDPENLPDETYLWDFGDGNTSTDASPTHTYSSTGTYSASLEVTENATVSAQTVTDTFTVTISEYATTPVLSDKSPSSPVSTNIGDEVTFSASVNQTTDNKWTIDGSLQEWDYSTDSPFFTHTINDSGSYTVTLTAYNTSDDTLTDSMSWTWEVEEEPYVPPETGGEYSTHINTLFENGGVWGLVLGTFTVVTDVVGTNMFFLLVLPLPFIATWIKQQSVVIPTVLYLTIGSVLVGVAPPTLQGPAFMMLGMGITGTMYHIFKNRR